MPVVRTVGPGEGAALRAIRLRALTDSPEAFAHRAADEAQEPDAFWERWAAGAEEVAFVAVDGAEWIGLAAGRWFERDAGIAQLWSMWVDPRCRGAGVAVALVSAVDRWAAAQEARVLRLGVVVRPGDARGFYARLGFTPTGEEHPVRADPSKWAYFMARPVRAIGGKS